MTPFLQLRLWWLRAAAANRAAAATAIVIVLALATWVLAPTTSDTTDVAATAGTAPGDTSAAAEAGTSTTAAGPQTSGQAATGGSATTAAAQAGGQAAGGDAAAASNPQQQCPPTPAGARGVTDDEVRIDVALLDLAGPIGNGAVSQASANEQQKISETIIADINANGGVACRSLKAKFYKVNPISPNATQAACIQMVQDQPAVVVDSGGLVYGNAFNCTAQQKVPTITIFNLAPAESAQFAPYLASPQADLGTAMRDVARGLHGRGFFDPAKGFEKLGILADECVAEVNKIFLDTLAKVGISGSKLSRYTFPCPENGFASPADMAQAVAKHNREGATHVVPLTGSGSFNTYADTAESQGYRPQYGISDYQGFPVTAESNLKPNENNFDGAIAITTTVYGLNNTEGLALDPGTKRCQALVQKAGFDPGIVYRAGGTNCDSLWTLQAALNGARALSPEAILPGLVNAGEVQMSYPLPNVTFQAPDRLYNFSGTWWPIRWTKDCDCWRVLDPNRKRSFAE